MIDEHALPLWKELEESILQEVSTVKYRGENLEITIALKNLEEPIFQPEVHIYTPANRSLVRHALNGVYRAFGDCMIRGILIDTIERVPEISKSSILLSLQDVEKLALKAIVELRSLVLSQLPEDLRGEIGNLHVSICGLLLYVNYCVCERDFVVLCSDIADESYFVRLVKNLYARMSSGFGRIDRVDISYIKNIQVSDIEKEDDKVLITVSQRLQL